MKRRDFLTSAPVAVAVSAAPVAAVASQWDATNDENPALLALGAGLPGVEKDYQEALAAWEAAWRIWSPQWPIAPEVCCNKFGSWPRVGERELETDLRGAPLRREGEKSAWYIKSAAEMEGEIDRALESLAKDDGRKKSYGRKFRQCRHEDIANAELGLALLPGYLAERKRIRQESGFDAIDKRREQASKAVFAFARSVLRETSLTVEGLRIKARACAFIDRMSPEDVRRRILHNEWENKSYMAASLGAAVMEVLA